MAVDVPFDNFRRPITVVQFGPVPGRMIPLRALVDTGADSSCIGIPLAKQLGLIRVNRRPRVMHDVERRHMCDVFGGCITIGNLEIPSPREFVAFPGLGAAGVGDFQVILGQDILANLLMHYDGPKGNLTLFRPDE